MSRSSPRRLGPALFPLAVCGWLLCAPAHAAEPAVSLHPGSLQLPPHAPPYLHKSWLSALQSPLPASMKARGQTVIQKTSSHSNALGILGHYQTNAPIDTARNAFFQSLGTNGRSCASCHLPSDGMSISAQTLKNTWMLSQGRDPVFAPVDGANCPNQVPSADTRRSLIGGLLGGAPLRSAADARSLLLERGLFRVFLPVPKFTVDQAAYGGAPAHEVEFSIKVLSDPYGCNTDPAYARVVDPVTQEATQMVSVYRRPRMSSNLKYLTTPSLTTLGGGALPNIDFVTGAAVVNPKTGLPISGNIMWDGREPTLESQARSATLGHAQATQAPTDAQIADIVAFEKAAFSAQTWNWWAGDLTGATGGAAVSGGPKPLASGTPQFSPTGFSLYDAWTHGGGGWGGAWLGGHRESIARGQAIFNTRAISVSGVAGFNNAALLGATNPQTTTCTSCHGNLGAGAEPLPVGQRAIGVGGGQESRGGPAPVKWLPIFKVTCRAPFKTPFDGNEVVTNDPGMALITGRCADIGRRTAPQLRALAARAPYFADGSVKTIAGVVEFYNARFQMKLTAQEKADLANFLGAL